MKKSAILIAAISLLFASGACTKPGVEDDATVLPPTTQEKEEQEETPEEPSVPVWRKVDSRWKEFRFE